MHRISIKVHNSDGTKTLHDLESYQPLFKEALREAFGRTLARLNSVPLKIEFIPIPEDDDAYKRLRSCTAKKAYVKEQQAVYDAACLNKKSLYHGLTERAYKCKYCNMFHVGREQGSVDSLNSANV